jgi:UDP-N-acetylmuramyl pentapeptide phosphotransferase/UDP-N-acetylglucosamine-1-phosphate transferase
VTPGPVRPLAAAALALAAERALRARPPGGAQRWRHTNHRGATVSLLSGPALALAATAAARLPVGAATAAGLGAGLVGAYDDAVGGRDDAKGFRGHLTALRQRRLTAGLVKIAGIGAVGLVAAAGLRPRRPLDVLLGGAVVAGSANLVNLLDLRPGRALKVGAVLSVAVGQPGVGAACAALLPGDLGERTMLGDAGANALGAVLGVALAERLPSRRGRAGALAVLAGLTAASEVVSFSAVIDATPPLRRLDRLGRRP